jgi:hypothetical protein
MGDTGRQGPKEAGQRALHGPKGVDSSGLCSASQLSPTPAQGLAALARGPTLHSVKESPWPPLRRFSLNIMDLVENQSNDNTYRWRSMA